jgi:hypothetical protein
MKRHYIWFITLLLTLSVRSRGQEDSAAIKLQDNNPGLIAEQADNTPPSEFDAIDQQSYRLYTEKKWDSLTGFCNRAIAAGTDYYLLRMRAGTAYFETGKYRAALMHFQKADEMNSSENFAKQYIYYCYLYTERPEHADWYSRKLYIAGNEKKDRPSALRSVTSEYGFKQTEHPAYKNPFFANVSLSHTTGARITLFHGFTYYTQRERRFEGEQFQYYFKMSVPLKKQKLFEAAFHFININGNLITYTNVVTTIMVQPPPPPGGTQSPPPFSVPITNRQQVFTGYQRPSFIGSIALTRSNRFFTSGFALTAARLDTTAQLQVEGNIAFFPLQNNKLSTGCRFILHTEPRPRTQSLAIVPWASFYVSPKFHVNLNALINPGNNISENVGYFVSNTTDFTRARLALTLSVRMSRNIWFYTLLAREEKLHINEIFHYTYNVFSAGFKIISF